VFLVWDCQTSLDLVPDIAVCPQQISSVLVPTISGLEAGV
jgi:hypothetical protein